MERKRADDRVCECNVVDGGNYSCCDRKVWDGGDYGCESNTGRRNVEFVDVHDYGFQCERDDDFANCDCWEFSEFHDRDSNSWGGVSGDSYIYGERTTDWSERFV